MNPDGKNEFEQIVPHTGWGCHLQISLMRGCAHTLDWKNKLLHACIHWDVCVFKGVWGGYIPNIWNESRSLTISGSWPTRLEMFAFDLLSPCLRTL